MLDEQPFRVFSPIDVDTDGRINFEETINFIGKKIEATLGHFDKSIYFNETARKYQETDSNEDGYIQPEEFDRQLS